MPSANMGKPPTHTPLLVYAQDPSPEEAWRKRAGWQRGATRLLIPPHTPIYPTKRLHSTSREARLKKDEWGFNVGGRNINIPHRAGDTVLAVDNVNGLPAQARRVQEQSAKEDHG